ncbi:MAG: cation-transporting P-type ATPase [Pseudomonadota bacterium]
MPHSEHTWHTLSTDEVAQRLNTNPQSGLSTAQTTERLSQFGPNALHEQRARSPWRMLLDQFTGFYC